MKILMAPSLQSKIHTAYFDGKRNFIQKLYNQYYYSAAQSSWSQLD